MAATAERLGTEFPDAETGTSADGISFIRVAPDQVKAALGTVRDTLRFERFVDLTAVDDPLREERFELNYLVYSMTEHVWLRIKARTADRAPSVVDIYPGANWYEREVWDLFGVRFEGHPDLTRIQMPDDWKGHPLRRDEPMGGEPVDFTVTRDVYGT
jgi:NADH-quinone oxidoreductase subunit C